MESLRRLLDTLISLFKRSMGLTEFKVVAPGESHSGRFYAIQAKDGDLTYSATTAVGDDIGSGSLLAQDASITGEFESISVDGGSSGDAVIYLL